METLHRYDWMYGKNYYMAKKKLTKDGFKLISFNADWEKVKIGEVLFSDGICHVRIKTSVSRNPKTNNWNCGTISEIREWTDD